jgi:hypothetical protein
MPQKYVYLLVGVAVGLVFSPQLRRLPLVSKLPSA